MVGPVIPMFLGFDSREPIAWQVAARSIVARASVPVSLTPLVLPQLQHLCTRERHALQSTEFSFTRFLVPHLCGYQGWAIFMDCDILMLDDIARLWSLRDDRFAVQVVQHDHRPTETQKFLGQPQTIYPKKNWSSVMLFNNARCTALTPEYVSTASGLDLHRFHWLKSDALIGALPPRWNHLVGYDPDLPPEEISNLHFTSGGPWFPDYSQVAYADLWRAELRAMLEPMNSLEKASPSAPKVLAWDIP